MTESVQVVVFALEEQRYALYLSAVERVLPAVELTPLPKAPEIVLGVLNLEGQVIPVVNVRRRFRLPDRDIDLRDRLIVAKTRKRPVALVVDSVPGLAALAEEQVTAANTILPGLEYVEGVARLEDGLILIHDLDKFLSLGEEKELTAALRMCGRQQ